MIKLSYHDYKKFRSCINQVGINKILEWIQFRSVYVYELRTSSGKKNKTIIKTQRIKKSCQLTDYSL